MRTHTTALLLLMLLTSPACFDEAHDAPSTAWRHPCGIAPYEWLPAEGMGQVIDTRKVDIFSLPRATIESLLGSQGYEALQIKFGAQVYQFRYTTQDRGVPLEATGVLAVPWPDDDVPLDAPYSLWLHGARPGSPTPARRAGSKAAVRPRPRSWPARATSPCCPTTWA